MNFCVAILIWNVEGKEQHFHLMLYHFQKGKNATEMWEKKKKDLYSVWKRVCDCWMCQKWFAKLHAGNFSLNDAPQLGRPVEVDKTETLIENNQHYTTWEIANILRVSKSSTENRLCQCGYVSCFDVWAPLKWKIKHKNFLAVFLHMILYLNVMKTVCF